MEIFGWEKIVLQDKSWREFNGILFSYSPSALADGKHFMKQNLQKIETELKKRLPYPYKWGRKQNNEFDKLTNFIYHTFLFDDVIKEINSRFKKDKEHLNISNYALNRWYNFWSAQAVEKIFHIKLKNPLKKQMSL